MENTEKMVESLYEKTIDYVRTSFELTKLKALLKAADVVSSFIPHSVVFVFMASCLLLFNLGLAFWLGEMLGEISYGFFIVAAFYGILGMLVYLLLHKWLKKRIGNYIIKLLQK
jgi:hypothetical protein